MPASIQYKRVYNGTSEFLELQNFADSFNHKIVEHPSINVFAHYKEGRLFGYSDHVFVPTIYPSFHPEHTRPRDVIQVMQDWRSHCQLAGSQGYLAVPLNNNDGKGNFPNEVMTKLGLTRLNRELYWPT
jgi:hypothetical protein